MQKSVSVGAASLTAGCGLAHANVRPSVRPAASAAGILIEYVFLNTGCRCFYIHNT
jgi:hypothetical protein